MNAGKDSGKGKSKGNGKGQGGKGKGGREGSDRKPDKDKNADQSRGNPNTTPGGNSEPSVGNQTRDLRCVPRRKPNKNKGLSVPTKMGTSLTPANAPVLCAWRGNFRRRGLK